ncbi:MAG: hypothetical protein A2W31_01305 [Planctomycetes bacterium RBG_16_64_10]|nr:MAG: hypothetical protein A2W31_01305 [Planctomycetes bacterium RBG_16_64_10]
MSSPLAFINGKWVQPSELTIPIYDAGFVLGATVTEQLRTFRGRLFRLTAHLDRLMHSLHIIQVDPGYSAGELADIATEVIRHNHPLVAEGDDLGLGMWVTPGSYPAFAGGVESGPTVCVHSYPLPFGLWANKYRDGERVVVSDVVQVAPRTWPPELKCRSRMHYFLADRRAQAAESGARAILLDGEGHVCEAATANVVMFRARDGLISPRHSAILPGISLMTLAELADGLGIPYQQRAIRPAELAAADELFLTSTSVCVLPVVRCDGQAVGAGVPGRIFRRLLAAWSELVGVEIESQAVRCAARRGGDAT